MKLISGIAGMLASGVGGYFLFLFFAFHNIYSTPPRELRTEIYLIEAVFSAIILLVLGMSISQVAKSMRHSHS